MHRLFTTTIPKSPSLIVKPKHNIFPLPSPSCTTRRQFSANLLPLNNNNKHQTTTKPSSNNTTNNQNTSSSSSSPTNHAKSVLNMTEEELRQHIPKFSNQDAEKLEKMLQDILSGKASSNNNNKSSSSSSDYRPLMIINVVLLALFLTSLFMRYRDELMHDMTRELLVDTRDELGNELLRVKQSRLRMLNELAHETDDETCGVKCQQWIKKWREQMEMEDQAVVNQIVADSLAQLNKKPSSETILDSGRSAASTLISPSSSSSTTTATEVTSNNNKSSRLI